MTKLPVHSFSDLITNSSTTIFTYSEASEAFLREMVEEFFKSFGVYNRFDEVFKTVVVCDDVYHYEDYIQELIDNEDELPEGIKESDDVKQLYDDVVSGKVEKPEWFKLVEESETCGDNCYTPDTDLYIIPLKPEYEKLAKAIKGFLYSTSHEATRDG